MIKKYRTKPVEIVAVEWNGKNKEEVYNFTEGNSFFDRDDFFVETLEGTMSASIGDYIIRGLRGEYYPCKPDVFHKKYEEVAE